MNSANADFLQGINKIYKFMKDESHVMQIRNTCQCRRCLDCQTCKRHSHYCVEKGIAAENGVFHIKIKKPQGSKFISKSKRIVIYAHLLDEEVDFDVPYWMTVVDPPTGENDWKITFRNVCTNERRSFPCSEPEIINASYPEDTHWMIECRFGGG